MRLHRSSGSEDHDVIVVGARCAGAATALLLARRGLRVLVLERGRRGADTLSTHALMRGGVGYLQRWGLLGRIAAVGTPPIRRTRFHYAADTMTVSIRPAAGVDALYAPRRTLLDTVLADAAAEAGADVRFEVTVTDLLRDATGRVAGVTARTRGGGTLRARAWLTVGADGVRSLVARRTGARTLRVGTGSGGIVYGHWRGLDVAGYEWFYRRGATAGLIPTNDGEVCVFAGVPSERFAREVAGDLHAYPGPLLPADEYEPWAAEARDRLRLRHLRMLRQARRWADLVEADPADADAHLERMRELAAAGDVRAALRQFERMDRALRQELGVGPSEEAVRLRNSLLVARPGEAPPTPLMGRDAQTAALRRTLAAAGRGRGRAVFVSGARHGQVAVPRLGARPRGRGRLAGRPRRGLPHRGGLAVRAGA